MTRPSPDTLRWDATHGWLLIDETLLQALSWPELLKLERSADGLILTAWDDQAAVQGQIVCSVSYEDEQAELPCLPSLTLTAEQAETLGLQEGDYSAWAASWDDCIYAIPHGTPAHVPSGLVAVTLLLTPREVQLLEQLALEHQARMTDLLTGFAADLAAEHAMGNERHELRSGGSDERMYADAWFQRNLAPGEWGGASADRGEFARRFRTSPTAEQQQAVSERPPSVSSEEGAR